MKNNPQIFEWKTATTGTLSHICTQLEFCQQNAMSRVFCDRADIGKTYAAKYYAERHKNVAYVDCSQCKSRHQFIRAIAKAFGLTAQGRIVDVYDDLVAHIKTLENPLIILDEGGDLDYNAFLEIKALWNALEGFCAWFMLGADGLKAKIERLRERKKVGFAEFMRRFGSNFLRVTPKDDAKYNIFFRAHAESIAKVNAPGAKLDDLLQTTKSETENGLPLHKSLERLKDNIKKHRKGVL